MFYATEYHLIYMNYDFYYFAFSFICCFFNCWYLDHDSDNDKLLNNMSVNVKQYIAKFLINKIIMLYLYFK